VVRLYCPRPGAIALRLGGCRGIPATRQRYTIAHELGHLLAGGGTQDQPTQHLGQAEMIFFLQEREPDWIFLSDDQAAVDLARRRGLAVIDTPQVLAECHAAYEIGCPDAYNLLLKMRDAGRGVRVPGNHRAVC
jgi:hypothetical protein